MIQSLMFRFATSIQNKVRFGYYFCLVLIIAVSLLNYLNLKRIDRKITFSFIISEFFDTTLEMRRFEKNYILYRDKEDYFENLRFQGKGSLIRFFSRSSGSPGNLEKARETSPDREMIHRIWRMG